MDNNYSLSDLAAVTNDGYGMGGGGLLILIVLFLLGGFGFNRGGEFGQYASAASQQEILFGQHFQNIDNKLDRLGNGIADATFALNNTVTTEGRAMQQQLSNVAAATNATTIAQTQKILDAMAQNKIDSLQAQVNRLETQNMFCGIPRINPYGYGVYPYANNCNSCPGVSV